MPVMTVDGEDQADDDRQRRVARRERQDEELALVTELRDEDTATAATTTAAANSLIRRRVVARRESYPCPMTEIAAPERDIVSWEDLDRLVGILADRLAGERFDVMLAITRGGHGAGRDARLSAAACATSSWRRSSTTTTPASPARTPTFFQFPADPLLRGKRVLVVDEVWDSGTTIHAVIERVRQAGGDAVHRGAPLQARALRRPRSSPMSTRSRPIAGSSIRSRPGSDARRRSEEVQSHGRVQLLVGTPKGAFILDSDADRRDWSMRGPLCEGWPIHDLIVEPGSGAILAAGGSPWYGPAVWRSEDGGETWTHSSVGLTYAAMTTASGEGEPGRSRRSGAWPPRRTARCSPASSRPVCSAATTAARPGRTSRA